MDAAFAGFEQFDMLLILTGAEDQPDRRFVIGLALIASEPRQVQLHLTFVCRLEVANLEFDGHQAA